MKKIFFIYALLICNIVCFGQAPDWTWAKGATSVSQTNAYKTVGFGVGIDYDGNSYVVGRFDSEQIQFGNFTLYGHGNADIFLVKYSPSGGIIWAKNFGGNNIDLAYSIAVAPNGITYITGETFSDTLNFQDIELTKKAM